MNRWFVAALITLALIVLVSPGIVGRIAEKSVEENLNFAASESDDVVVTTESFERGWFASEGRHRIETRRLCFSIHTSIMACSPLVPWLVTPVR